MSNISDNYEFNEEQIEKIKTWMDSLNIGNNTKRIMYKITDNSVLSYSEREAALYNLFDGKRLAIMLGQFDDKNSSELLNIDNHIKSLYDIDDVLAQGIRQIMLNLITEMTQSNEFKVKIEHFSQFGGAI